MIRKIPLYVLLLCVLFSCALSGAAAPSRKPLPPLRISISPVQPGIISDYIKPGDVIEFKVTALSSIDVPEMSIKVELVDGAKLVSGDTSWSGPAAKNEKKSVILTVQAPEKGKGALRARVSLPQSGNTRFSNQALYELGPEVKFKPEQEHPVKKDHKGRDVIEYR